MLLAVGSTVARDMQTVPGRDLNGIHLAMDYLTYNTKVLRDIHIYVYTHVYMYVYIYVYVYMYSYTCIYVYPYIYMYVCVYIYVCT